MYFAGTATSRTDGEISVKLKKRFAYRYSPKKEGVDKTTWWPMKRHSYSKVKFSDWSGTYVKDQVVSFPEKRVFNAKIRVVNGILMALKDECKRGTH